MLISYPPPRKVIISVGETRLYSCTVFQDPTGVRLGELEEVIFGLLRLNGNGRLRGNGVFETKEDWVRRSTAMPDLTACRKWASEEMLKDLEGW